LEIDQALLLRHSGAAIWEWEGGLNPEKSTALEEEDDSRIEGGMVGISALGLCFLRD